MNPTRKHLIEKHAVPEYGLLKAIEAQHEDFHRRSDCAVPHDHTIDEDVVRRLRSSQRQEQRGARRLGGRVTQRSGAGWKVKGDVRTETELVEYKRTDKQQITLKARDLEKITAEALVEGRQALLGFQVGGRNYVVLTDDTYEELRGSGPERVSDNPAAGDL